MFRPATPNGAAMLVIPGGGYELLVYDKEGYDVARWLAAQGVTAFVLFYRLPADGWRNDENAPFADAQRAMRLIRRQAAQWRIDPARVGAMGFSAGGHLCADLATRSNAAVGPLVDGTDAIDARPLLAAPIYPVVSMDPAIAHAGSRAHLIGADAPPENADAYSADRNVTRDTPPIFLAHAEDDGVVPIENSLRLRAALRAAGVPVETHLFEKGGHGFALRGRGPVAAWPGLFLAWAKGHGLFG